MGIAQWWSICLQIKEVTGSTEHTLVPPSGWSLWTGGQGVVTMSPWGQKEPTSHKGLLVTQNSNSQLPPPGRQQVWQLQPLSVTDCDGGDWTDGRGEDTQGRGPSCTRKVENTFVFGNILSIGWFEFKQIKKVLKINTMLTMLFPLTAFLFVLYLHCPSPIPAQ